jgi:hypothetical protein
MIPWLRSSESAGSHAPSTVETVEADSVLMGEPYYDGDRSARRTSGGAAKSLTGGAAARDRRWLRLAAAGRTHTVSVLPARVGDRQLLGLGGRGGQHQHSQQPHICGFPYEYVHRGAFAGSIDMNIASRIWIDSQCMSRPEKLPRHTWIALAASIGAE